MFCIFSKTIWLLASGMEWLIWMMESISQCLYFSWDPNIRYVGIPGKVKATIKFNLNYFKPMCSNCHQVRIWKWNKSNSKKWMVNITITFMLNKVHSMSNIIDICRFIYSQITTVTFHETILWYELGNIHFKLSYFILFLCHFLCLCHAIFYFITLSLVFKNSWHNQSK